MRCSQLCILFACALSLPLLAGCGPDSGGPAKPAAEMDEIQQFLADNPDQNVDDLEDSGEDDEDDLE
jgi:hypothetical protein